MDFKILYEDNDIVAIDKPSGISVHPDGRSEEKCVTDWFLEKYPEAGDVGEPLCDIKRPGIVHRLDRETSGVLLLAKTKESHTYLKKQFQERTIKKIYLAIVSGWLKKDQGVIDEPIGRSPSDFRRRLAGRGARGEMREAVTEYKVLDRIEDDAGNKFSFLEIHPKTGRTHQIRVHMKFLSYPVLCDSLYSPKNFCPSELGRLALHASEIEFQNLKGELVKVNSSTPLQFFKLKQVGVA